MITDRIILGTANFVNEYNGTKAKDPDAILDYARSIGILGLDTAVAYDTCGLDYENKIVKLRKNDCYGINDDVYCFMAHNEDALENTYYHCSKYWVNHGISIYDDIKIPPMIEIIQLPYSIINRTLEHFMEENFEHYTFIARSVFLRGKVLEVTTPFKALAFVLMNPFIDKVVIGTDSVDMLKSTLEPFLELETYKSEDKELIDPRYWR